MMTVTEILEQLEFNTGTFPHEALQEAISMKEEIIPELLKILEFTKINARELSELKDPYWSHIFAMFLLAQFRETKAFPLIIDIISFPEKIVEDMLGEVITESLEHILASVYNGDILLLKNIIEDDNIYEFVRSAAISTLNNLVFENILDRREIINYYRELFNGGLNREYNFVWNGLVDQCRDLYAVELIDDIRLAYEDGLVDELFIDFKSIDNDFKKDEKTFFDNESKYSSRPRLIEDTIEELEWWACFQPKETKTVKNWDGYQSEGVQAFSNKIGRNEPCPCGSGKKYKKCCGKSKEQQ